jgi:hypothetical protein
MANIVRRLNFLSLSPRQIKKGLEEINTLLTCTPKTSPTEIRDALQEAMTENCVSAQNSVEF